MIEKHISTFALLTTLLLSSNAFAAKLNVPADFPNSFHMDLLSGSVIVDFATGTSPVGEIPVLPTGGVSQILFDATAFDATGFGYIGIGEGTSNLTLTSTFSQIASFDFAGVTGSFYLDGSGLGTLTDKGDGTGDWSMGLPLFAEWNGTTFNFTDLILSSNATYSFNTATGPSSISGTSMSYETGDTFLVGQSTVITDGGHPFEGLRITLGMNGNDPVSLSAVPVPAAVWLFGSGLIGLAGFARRKTRA